MLAVQDCVMCCCDWQQAITDLDVMHKHEKDQQRSTSVKDKVCRRLISSPDFFSKFTVSLVTVNCAAT